MQGVTCVVSSQVEAVWVSKGSSAGAAGFTGERFLRFSWTHICLLVLCRLHRAGNVASAQAVSGSCGSVIPPAHDPSLRVGCQWLTCTAASISQSALMSAFVVHAITITDSARGGSSWAACSWTKAQKQYPSQSLAAGVFCQEPEQQAVWPSLSSKPASQSPTAGTSQLSLPAGTPAGSAPLECYAPKVYDTSHGPAAGQLQALCPP